MKLVHLACTVSFENNSAGVGRFMLYSSDELNFFSSSK